MMNFIIVARMQRSGIRGFRHFDSRITLHFIRATQIQINPALE